MYPAAHSVVCYSAHQATTDLLENMPQLLGLTLFGAEGDRENVKNQFYPLDVLCSS